MTSKIVYKGSLRTEATHEKSGSVLTTDAPVDNHGKGEKFSPTDLVATALGCCMLTVMGIAARDRNLALENTSVTIEKIMAEKPRRIAEVRVHIDFPPNNGVGPSDREHLERLALGCPVARSIHPDMMQKVTFDWHV